jgi:RNA polymerase sigma factor (sigma-70 family)
VTLALFRTDKDIKEIYDRNFDSVYRISYMYMRNKYDAEDITQSVFTKMITKNKMFENIDHEKAWLTLVTINTCKNHFKTWWNRNVSYEEIELGKNDSKDEVLEVVLNLPIKYKDIIYLYYYEGYSTKEIASLIGKNENTIRSNLKRARHLLKEALKEDFL